MKRIASLLLVLSLGFVCASHAEAVGRDVPRGKAPARRRLPARQPSILLPRLERGPDGRILGEEWEREVRRRAAEQKAASRTGAAKTPRTAVRNHGQYTKDTFKRGAGKWPKVDPTRNVGRSTIRDGGRHTKDNFKRGAGKWPKTDPRGLAKGSPRTGRGGKALKAVGGIGAAVGIGAAAGGIIANSQKLDADLRAGRITRAQYNRAQATGAVNAAGTVIAIKKMTPAAIAGNALIGTDPISLGVDAVGDLINGTGNASRSLANVGRTLEGHARGVQKLVTNPAAWANEAGHNIEKELNKVGRGLDKAGKDVGRALNQAGKDVDKFFKGIFGG
jgi:hypothetical protein